MESDPIGDAQLAAEAAAVAGPTSTDPSELQMGEMAEGAETVTDLAPEGGAPAATGDGAEEEAFAGDDELGVEDFCVELKEWKFPAPPTCDTCGGVKYDKCGTCGKAVYPGYLGMMKKYGGKLPCDEDAPQTSEGPAQDADAAQDAPGPEVTEAQQAPLVVPTGEHLWFASRAADSEAVEHVLAAGVPPDDWVPQKADVEEEDEEDDEDDEDGEDGKDKRAKALPPHLVVRPHEVGMTALCSASARGHAEVVRALIAAGASVERPSAQGLTPLACASQRGHPEVAKLLLGASADASKAPPQGHAPLFYAISRGHLSVVQELLKSGADPTQLDVSGQTPLIAACCTKKPKVKVVKAVAAACASANPDGSPESRFGSLPLIISALKGRGKVVKALLDSGADPNLANEHGIRPLAAAIKQGHNDVAALLIQGGADINNLGPFKIMSREEAVQAGATLYEPPSQDPRHQIAAAAAAKMHSSG